MHRAAFINYRSELCQQASTRWQKMINTTRKFGWESAWSHLQSATMWNFAGSFFSSSRTRLSLYAGLQGPRWAARRNRSSQSDSVCVWFWGSWGSGIVLENCHCPETQRTLCFSIWGCFRGRFAKKQRKRDDDSLRRTSEYPTNHILVENQIILWGTNGGGGPARWALPSIKRRDLEIVLLVLVALMQLLTEDEVDTMSQSSAQTHSTHTVNAALSLHHKNKVWALDRKPQCDLKSYFFPLKHKPTFGQRKSC